MSHDGSWRAACHITIYFLWLHFETLSIARGVTDPGVGSGALLGDLAWKREITVRHEFRPFKAGVERSASGAFPFWVRFAPAHPNYASRFFRVRETRFVCEHHRPFFSPGNTPPGERTPSPSFHGL